MENTSFLVSNLISPSDVSKIEDTLFALNPEPFSISCSAAGSRVALQLHHDPSLSPDTIRKALEDAGFNVCNTTTDEDKDRDGHRSRQFTFDQNRQGGTAIEGNSVSDNWKISKLLPRRERRHIEICSSCQAEEEDATVKNSTPGFRGSDQSQEHPGVSYDDEKGMETVVSESIGITTSDIRVTIRGSDTAESSFVVVDDGERSDLWRASLAIGGMTCVACVNSIKGDLQQRDWIRKVDINLIMNSATVEFVGKSHKDEIVELIESIGFDAFLDKVVKLSDTQEVAPRDRVTNEAAALEETPRRILQIKIAGMSCDNCPHRVLRYLGTYEDRGVQIDEILTLEKPIVEISYTPHPRYLNIRQIMAGLKEIDPKLVPSIYRPPTLEERSRALHTQERLRIVRRVILCVALAIPTFLIGILYMSIVSSTDATRIYLEEPLLRGVTRAQFAMLIISTPVYFFAADVFHLKALKEVQKLWRRNSKVPVLQRFYRFGSMNMLISLGTSIAYISSAAQLIDALAKPKDINTDGCFYFDSVVYLTMFLLIGRLIEAYSKSRTGDAVAMLGKLRPARAILVDIMDNIEYGVDVDMLEFGDLVRVVQGATPPNDGRVTQGETVFDESSLTGESKLVNKHVGDMVYSGTVNKGSSISVTVTGVAGTSMIDRIIEVVREGQTRHAPIERIADTLTGYFVPFITLIAISTWIVWLGLGTSQRLPAGYLDTMSGGWPVWSLQFAIAVFVVACPCGLGLAAPTAIFVGGGLAANHGILVKGGGEAFEKASRLDCIVFDKTGTLTNGGEPIVTNYVYIRSVQDSPSSRKETEILSMTKKLEENSSHPIAKAIVSFCKKQDLQGGDLKEATELAGKGMKGVYEVEDRSYDIEMLAGNETLINEHEIHIDSQMTAILNKWKSQGKSVVLIATRSSHADEKWQMAVLFGISVDVRPEAVNVIKALHQRGTAVWMLSGDNYDSACAIGAQVGIAKENIFAGVLPSEKAEKIQYLQKSLKARKANGEESTHRRALVAMVGDGINDAPALTAADVGIAIGSGSDIAISSAEFVLVSSNLETLVTLLDLSKTVFQRIKFNFGWALIYNMIGVPIAAGVLYPVVVHGSHVRLDPVWASLAMALSSISVVCSSLSLRSKIPGIGFRSRKPSL